MRLWRGWGCLLLMATWVASAPSSDEDKTDPSLEESIKEQESKDMEEVKAIHHRVLRQIFDGFRLENSLKDGISALENVDDMLRKTIPNVDKFQCLERLMCSVMSADTSSLGSQATSFLEQAFDPTFQQGAIQDPQAISQDFLQNPTLQGLFSQSQNPSLQGLQNPSLQGLLQGQPTDLTGLLSQISNLQQGSQSPNPAFQQGFASPNPALQQGFAPPNPAFQQGFPPNPAFQQQNPAFQQGLLQQPAFQNPAFHPPPPPPPGFHPQFQPPPGQIAPGAFPGTFQGTQFQNSFANFRELPDTHRRTSNPRPQRRRRPLKRTQRNGFFDFLGRLGLGRRKKRSVLTDLLGGFTGERIFSLFDQMMTDYSFYPYTHAAFMGYTGSPRRCETLYPSCPSTPEEMIDVFNNIHRHYPEGIPYKENLPWPLNILLP